jgi:asparagine synthase (glutamine-hydrolysing)
VLPFLGILVAPDRVFGHPIVADVALRQVLNKHVPRKLIERPKAGFGIPVGQWLRGPLRPWAESLLNEQRLQSEGYFFPAPILQRWREHVSGQRDHTHSLWVVLMFQAWLESVS